MLADTEAVLPEEVGVPGLVEDVAASDGAEFVRDPVELVLIEETWLVLELEGNE